MLHHLQSILYLEDAKEYKIPRRLRNDNVNEDDNPPRVGVLSKSGGTLQGFEHTRSSLAADRRAGRWRQMDRRAGLFRRFHARQGQIEMAGIGIIQAGTLACGFDECF